jgi:HD-GYP domain-containing protein (c-di-GMP phosphodiesterase class II)
MEQPRVDDEWKDRRILSAALGLAIFLFPVLCALAITLAADHVVARPVTVVPLVLWIVAVLALSTAVYVLTERFKVLLRMGLAFPDRAPKRLAVARRAASVRDLDRRVADARAHGIADEPTEAAEKIVTLAAAMSAHDRSTRGHSERVRALTDMIAVELRLTAADQARLRWSALLHDVGKLAVHPDVLNKPGELDDDEWQLVRQHPLEGAKLTAPLAGWLGSWSSTIAEHHERYDGKGYPTGLAGRDISYGGRIVAVADSYDVMTAARSYKKPLGPAAARRELTACAGTQFDPEVVRAFLAVSVWRVRFVAPLSWLGSLGVARFGAVARLGSATAQSVATGLVAAGGVVGLTLVAPVGHLQRVPAGDLHAATVSRSTPGTSVPPAASSTTQPQAGAPTTTTSQSGASATTTLPPGNPTTSTTAGGSSSTTSTSTSTTVQGTPPPASTTTVPLAGTTTTTSTTTTTTSTTTTTTTTVPSTTTTTTTTTSTTTTTLPTRAPPAPPTALKAGSSCQVIVLSPVITLTWRVSTTTTVTSQLVLRGTAAGSLSSIAAVPAGATSYTDKAVDAGLTYWYAVEALAPGGKATSEPVKVRAPCIALGPPSGRGRRPVGMPGAVQPAQAVYFVSGDWLTPGGSRPG